MVLYQDELISADTAPSGTTGTDDCDFSNSNLCFLMEVCTFLVLINSGVDGSKQHPYGTKLGSVNKAV